MNSYIGEESNKSDNNNKSKKIFKSIYIPIILSIISVIYINYVAFIKESSDQFAPLAIFGLPAFIATIWGIYFVWLFIKNKVFKNKRFSSILSIILLVLIIAILPILIKFSISIIGHSMYLFNQANRSIPHTVSSIVGKSVYIYEDHELTPYIVVDNNYGYEKNSLLVRKNVLNKKIDYVDDYKKTIINGDFGGFYTYKRYEESNVDKYLLSDQWLKRFDESFLNSINNTKLYYFPSTPYDDTPYNFAEKDIEYIRKFFIPSNYDIQYGYLTESEKEHLYQKNNQHLTYLTYLDEELNNSQIYDDNGNKVAFYWQRVDDSPNNELAIVKNGKITYINYYDIINNNVEPSYIRPSFTVPNSTKIKEVNNSTLGTIYEFDF